MNFNNLLDKLSKELDRTIMNFRSFCNGKKFQFHLYKERKEYNKNVSKSQHSNALESAKLLATEFIDYLSQITFTGGLSPIRPSKPQIALTGLLIDSAKNGSLIYEENKKLQNQNQEPTVLLFYKSKVKKSNDEIFYESLYKKDLPHEVHFNIACLVNNNKPRNAAFYGFSTNLIDGFDFTFTNKKIESQDDLDEISFLLPPESNVEIYDDGKQNNRFIINSSCEFQGKIIENISQYFYLGAFISESTEKELHVYAQNQDRHHNYRQVSREYQRELSPVKIKR